MSISIQRPSENIELKLPEPMVYIYRFCGPTGKSYVGQTKDIPRRISQHLDGDGSKLLLTDLVEYGRKAFTIEILEVLTTDDPEVIASVEDFYIEELDTIHPLGYNKRTNREPTANGEPVDLSNIEISAKYVFESGKQLCFTVGAASQHRSYQTLCNAGDLLGLSKKRNRGFDFFELRVQPSDSQAPLASQYGFAPSVVYDMTLKHENGVWKILEVWHAV